MRDDLGQHRIVSIADHVALADAGIDPNALRPGQVGKPPGGGQESRFGLLRVQPGLDGVPANLRRRPQSERGERLAAGDPQLIDDQVATGDQLGDRVLHLEPRVHLQEEELAVIGQQHLDRAGIRVANRGGDRDRGVAHPPPQLRRDGRRRCLFHDLLISPLCGAVALAQGQPVPVCVEQDLHLDVARALEVALQDQPIITEGAMRLAPRGVDCLR